MSQFNTKSIENRTFWSKWRISLENDDSLRRTNVSLRRTISSSRWSAERRNSIRSRSKFFRWSEIANRRWRTRTETEMAAEIAIATILDDAIKVLPSKSTMQSSRTPMTSLPKALPSSKWRTTKKMKSQNKFQRTARVSQSATSFERWRLCNCLEAHTATSTMK